LEKLYKYITLATQGFLVLVAGTMTVIVILEVVLRYGFNTGFSWSEELSRFLFVALTFIGASEALRRGRHVSVVIFINKLPNGMRKKVNFVVRVFMLLFLLLFAYSSLILLKKFHFQLAPALRISMAWPHSALFLGAILMLFQLVWITLKGSNRKEDSKVFPKDEV